MEEAISTTYRKRVDAEGGKTEYEYDADDNVISITDPNGNKREFDYDLRGRLTREYDAKQPLSSGSRYQQSYEYDGVGNLLSVTDRRDHQTQYVYDDLNRLIEHIDAENESTFFGYDAVGNLTLHTDALQRETQFRYDNRDRQIERVNAFNDSASYTYDDVGNMLTATDELNRTMTYEYDARHRLTSVENPLKNQTSYEYDGANNLTQVTDARTHRTEYRYDELNRLMEAEDPLSQTVSYTYDLAGNLVEFENERGYKTTFKYDKRNWRTEVSDPLGHITKTEYDANGNVIRMTNELGHETDYKYDDLNRLVATTDALNQTTRMSYDPDGNLASITDPAQNTTSYKYDKVGRLKEETNELGHSRSYDYDKVGNLTLSTDRSDRQIEYTYDKLNRLDKEEWHSDGSTPGNVIDYTYDDASQLVEVSDAYSTYSYEYDRAGRLTQVDNDGTPNAPHVVFDYVHDQVGNVTSVTDTINGDQKGEKTYVYDKLNRLDSLTQTGDGVADKYIEFDYNKSSQLTSIQRYSDLSRANEVAETTYDYDKAGRLTDISHSHGGTTIADYEFDYDKVNRLTELTSPDGSSVYTYDDRHQLTDATHSYQDNEDYRYDENGNRDNDGYEIDDNNQLKSDGTYSYTYDNEGNRTSRTHIDTGEVTEYRWDHRNRLTEVVTKDSSGVVTHSVAYTYDAFDRRIAKAVDNDGVGTDPATTEHLVYEGAHVSLVFDESGNLTQRYLYGPQIDQVLAQEDTQTGEVLWALTDHQGTVRDVINNDGEVVNHITYDSFGQITSETNADVNFRFGFTGRDVDEETDLYYYRARYYDPEVGQFISEDPIGFSAGDANLRRYVDNSPLNGVDPSGNETLWFPSVRFLDDFDSVSDALDNGSGSTVVTSVTQAPFDQNESLPGLVNRINDLTTEIGVKYEDAIFPRAALAIGLTEAIVPFAGRILNAFYGEALIDELRNSPYYMAGIGLGASSSLVLGAANPANLSKVIQALDIVSNAEEVVEISQSLSDISRGEGDIGDYITLGSSLLGGLALPGRRSGDDIPNNGRLVTNKFPDEGLDPAGKIFGEAQVINGRINLNGRQIPRNVDFVITKDNRLILGSKHTTLSNGEDVLAAGQLKIDGSGRIRRIDNGSGHFRPTVEESLRVPELLRSLGLNVSGARFLSHRFRVNADGLIVGNPETVVNQVLD